MQYFKITESEKEKDAKRKDSKQFVRWERIKLKLPEFGAGKTRFQKLDPSSFSSSSSDMPVNLSNGKSSSHSRASTSMTSKESTSCNYLQPSMNSTQIINNSLPEIVITEENN